jgi:RNA polymerase sigma-70 factor (ECF subfamily)
MKEDAQWVKQSIAGDERGFHRLIIKYQSAIYRLILSRVKNYDDAQELTQEVFLKAYQKLDLLRKPGQFYPWLRQIAENQCRDWQRKRRAPYLLPTQTNPGNEMPSVDESLLLRETLARVMEAIDELPEVEKELLKERYLDGDSYVELQARHRLSYGAVAMRLHRAKQKVKEKMKKVRSGVVTFRWKDAMKGSILGRGLEIMKLSVKTKLIVSGVALMGAISIVTWHTIDKPAREQNQTTSMTDQTTRRADTPAVKTALSATEDPAKEVSEVSQKELEEAIAFLDELGQTEGHTRMSSKGDKDQGNSAEKEELSLELKRKAEQYARLAVVLPQLRKLIKRGGQLCEENRQYARRRDSLSGTPDAIPEEEQDSFFEESDREIRANIAEQKIYYAQIDEMFPELELYEEWYDDTAEEWNREQYAFRGMLLIEYFGRKLPWDGNGDYLNAELWDGSSHWRVE